jgi:bacterial/archaeal transporter family-2 protein
MSSNTLFMMVLALVAGAMMPTQAATNNKMAVTVGSPIFAAFLSFLVGTILLLAATLFSGLGSASYAAVTQAPPIAWIGGLLGACFVTAAVLLVPKLGVAMTFSLFVAGQLLMSLIIDHYGLLGVEVKEISLPRIAGIVLITAGVILIRKF